MTYRCGIGPGLGGASRPPTIFCDGANCGAIIAITGDPPAWFLARKPKRGWSLERTENEDGSVTRKDLCPACRAGVKR